MKEGLPQRDEKGDFIYKLPRVDRQKERWWDHTHVCLYRDESRDTFLPYFGIAKYDDDALAKAKQTESFFQADLFYTPDTPPFDFFIGYHNWQLQLRVHYFKEVFEEQAFIQGYMPSHEFFRLIMPKSKYEEIINCINNFGLLTLRDLLFEVIRWLL